MIEARRLTEEECVTAMETVGDTDVYGVFEDGQLLVVGQDYSGAGAQRVAAALREEQK